MSKGASQKDERPCGTKGGPWKGFHILRCLERLSGCQWMQASLPVWGLYVRLRLQFPAFLTRAVDRLRVISSQKCLL